jgi:hypothetical protein
MFVLLIFLWFPHDTAPFLEGTEMERTSAVCIERGRTVAANYAADPKVSRADFRCIPVPDEAARPKYHVHQYR